jgi:hypothetical protein
MTPGETVELLARTALVVAHRASGIDPRPEGAPIDRVFRLLMGRSARWTTHLRVCRGGGEQTGGQCRAQFHRGNLLATPMQAILSE